METLISKKRLIEELRARPGLIPFTIDPDRSLVKWIDFEKYHFYEGFAFMSRNRFFALKELKSSVVSFSTDCSVLEDEGILDDFIYPSAFIFNASRCGSTSLAKAFSRSRQNLVLSEFDAHGRMPRLLTKNGTTSLSPTKMNLQIYKNLFLATARKRLASHRNCITKFTSYTIFHYDFIRKIFPDVPAVFLYRKPSGILSSIEKGPMSWIKNENQNLRKLRTRVSEKEFKNLDFRSYVNRVISEFYSAALDVNDNKLHYFNFKNLKAENFHSIVEMLNLNFDEEELNKMKSQFNYYSKSEDKLVKFSENKIEELQEDEETYKKNISPELRTLYEKLIQKESAQGIVKK